MFRRQTRRGDTDPFPWVPLIMAGLALLALGVVAVTLYSVFFS